MSPPTSARLHGLAFPNTKAPNNSLVDDALTIEK